MDDIYRHVVTLTAAMLSVCGMAQAQQQESRRPTFHEYIRDHIPARGEIDVFLNEMSWAQYDPVVGYILGNYLPRDGIDGSLTISTVQANGARTSHMYRDKRCRINTYGNSFTHCHQVSDGETWQEYLAAHLGEPIRNFGMGGFGVYQAYRRMVREEQSESQAPYVMLYIWGDDHLRSLLRCRYMLISSWNRKQNDQEGRGRMFHGNFWSNIELDLESGRFVEKDNLCATRESLYNMADPDWMVDHLQDDLALQMALFANRAVADIDVKRLKQLSIHLKHPLGIADGKVAPGEVASLLDTYALAATKVILSKARNFTQQREKKLMVIIFDPYRVMRPLLEGHRERYDQEIVDYLRENQFNYFDMNVVHLKDYEAFNLSPGDYMKRYFIGHYSPTGNHFFAYAIKDRVVEWLDPKPVPYRESKQKIIDFRGYLQNYSAD